MAKVLVIGYGNSLRSDDNIGLVAVRELSSKLKDADVEFVEAHQLNMEFAEKISRTELVIFIDAATSGLSGEVEYSPVHAARKKDAPMSHYADPSSLLNTAGRLYGKTPLGLQATVAGGCFGYGTRLSPEVDRAVRGVVEHLSGVIRDFIAGKAMLAAQ